MPINDPLYASLHRNLWHSRKDNLLLANLLGQTHVFNIDPNFPHSVGMFVAHRILRSAGE
jgi:hypothetical protein